MMKFSDETILHNTEYSAISVTVDEATTGTVTEKGRKYLPAGTMIAGDGASIFKDRTKKAKAGTVSTADAILLKAVDLTDGDAVGTAVYAGTLRSDRVIGYADGLDARLPRIQFVKGV